jgi:hypothetical protein
MLSVPQQQLAQTLDQGDTTGPPAATASPAAASMAQTLDQDIQHFGGIREEERFLT